MQARIEQGALDYVEARKALEPEILRTLRKSGHAVEDLYWPEKPPRVFVEGHKASKRGPDFLVTGTTETGKSVKIECTVEAPKRYSFRCPLDEEDA